MKYARALSGPSKDSDELRHRLAADPDQLMRTLEEIRELERHRQKPAIDDVADTTGPPSP
jgi:hypothetical protein